MCACVFGVGLVWVLAGLVWVWQKELRFTFVLQFPFNKSFGFLSHVSVSRLCVCACVWVLVWFWVLAGLVWVWQNELRLTFVFQFPFNIWCWFGLGVGFDEGGVAPLPGCT